MCSDVVAHAAVDGYLNELNWLQTEPLRKAEFWEDRNGNCRTATSLVLKLCETSETWRKLVARVAEYVAQMLWSSIPRSSSTLARQVISTRLTNRKKREVKGSDVPTVDEPKPEHVCNGCGKPIRVGRSHCAQCAISDATERLTGISRFGRQAAHTREARAKQGEKQRKHAVARSSWSAIRLCALDARIKFPLHLSRGSIDGKDLLRRRDSIKHAVNHDRTSLEAAGLLRVERSRNLGLVTFEVVARIRLAHTVLTEFLKLGWREVLVER
jgi:hypothetical protein